MFSYPLFRSFQLRRNADVELESCESQRPQTGGGGESVSDNADRSPVDHNRLVFHARGTIDRPARGGRNCHTCLQTVEVSHAFTYLRGNRAGLVRELVPLRLVDFDGRDLVDECLD